MTVNPKMRGFTLIEYIVALVVMALGISAFMTATIAITKHSTDPMLLQQAHAIAQSYLEEVLLNPFCDPDLSTDCPVFCNAGRVCTSCSENTGGTETRASFDDVCDYAAVSDTAGAKDQSGTAITGLGDYNISVNVDDGNDGSEATLNGLSSLTRQVLRVDVNITHDVVSGINVRFSGYKANY